MIEDEIAFANTDFTSLIEAVRGMPEELGACNTVGLLEEFRQNHFGTTGTLKKYELMIARAWKQKALALRREEEVEEEEEFLKKYPAVVNYSTDGKDKRRTI